MAERTTQGILLVSDISGYTDFVRQHTRSASHARQITVRLLKAMVSAASPPLSVALVVAKIGGSRRRTAGGGRRADGSLGAAVMKCPLRPLTDM